MLFTAASLLAVASAVSAQQVIKVGATMNDQGGIFQFIPPTINAKNGTVVSFQFTGAPGNHTVTQSTFQDPCNPTPGGFDSGWVFIPDASALTETPMFNLTITDDTKPIWFFCKQLAPSPHCPVGMVGAINPPTSGNTFEAFQKNAESFQGASGQGQGGLVGIGASASAGVGPVPASVQLFSGVPVGTGSGSAGASNTGASGSPSQTAGTTTGGAANSPPASTPTSPATGNTPAPSPSGGGALAIAGNTAYVALAAAFGFILA
ncbi:hypothetical protein CVT24_000719 [Panaeolus cyanescens]|uniref:Blue (type 1) copper domain-containing protein n=1 Tax=Panaeolus cyanescens TaxID=181874 RepID=A0A409YT28_9AGAR|nr:hypothetical protein CVT24_000719 [Panaeolus cyanescens]